MEIKLSEKYEPLFALLDGNFPQVDTVIITGGRYSQKSFAVGLAACIAAKDFNHRVLYTRYTLTSAEDSIIPEFGEKIDMLNAHEYFSITRDRIIGTHNISKIVFKGIKTSAGNQTASLKSLKDFSMFILEEAEEMPDFSDWDKVRKSIRALDVQNINILILNPASKEHWVYTEFFEGKGIQEGWNGIHENVLYIHTTYHDLDRQFIPDSIWNDFESKREAYEEYIRLGRPDDHRLRRQYLYYKHVILGGWLDKSEGVVFDNWEVGDYINTGLEGFGSDFGFSNDPTTLVQASIDNKLKRIYLRECLYRVKMVTSDIVESMRHHAKGKLIIGDSAEPRLIEEIKRQGVNIEAAVKGQGSITAGIAIMQDYTLVIDPSSTNLIKELNNYVWNDKKSGVPVDAYNHCIDAARYIITKLVTVPRRMTGSFAQLMRR